MDVFDWFFGTEMGNLDRLREWSSNITYKCI